MRNMSDDELDKLMHNTANDIINNQHRHLTSSISWSHSPTQRSDGTYLKPEQDEQGTFYGYKILYSHCVLDDCLDLISPRYPVFWTGGELTSDIEPNEIHNHGIHFTKTMNHPELRSYMYTPYGRNVFLVKCALSGTIVETQQGFRVQHAQIIGIYSNGYWQSYQDYQERARANSDRTPYYDPSKDYKR